MPDNNRSAQLAAARQALLKKKLQQSSDRAGQITTTIAPRALDAKLPLSSGQMRLWYLSQFEDSRAIHNIVTALRLQGTLDKDRLESAINKVIARHEALRMHFREVDSLDDQIELAIVENVAFEIESIDLRSKYQQLGQQVIDETIRELSLLAFDLDCAPFIRVHYLCLSASEHILFISAHHAVFDGISQNIFLAEMFHYYAKPEDSSALPSPALQYGDYCVWEKDYFKTPELQRQLDYWLDQLSGDLPVLDLPLDMPRKPQQSFTGESQTLLLEPELLAELENFAKTQNSTLFMLMLTVFYTLLHRYTGQRDFIIGTPIAGRSLPQLHNAIGYFANTLALRTRIGENETFLELLKNVSESCLSAYENQDLPFELLVEKLNPPRDLSRTPIYQAFFGFQVYENIDTGSIDLQCQRLPLGTYLSRTDLSLWHERDEDGIHVCAEYCSDLFSADTISGFLTHYHQLLRAVLDHSDLKPAQVPMLVDADYKLLASRNKTDRDRIATSVIDMFGLQVAQNAHKAAVFDNNGSLSYEQLQLQSTELANYLQALGVTPGDCIGLCLNRSNTMLVAALAIWKAGAAYVPLDPSFPTQRLLYMLDTANISFLVTESKLEELLLAHDCKRVIVDREAAAISAASTNPAVANTPQSLAYVIFTSGSTGKPKGVRIPHGAVTNFLSSMASEPGLTREDVLLAVTTLSFDIAVLELYLPLLVGATVVIADSEQSSDGNQLKSLIANHRATTMQATPSTWRLLLASGWQGDNGFKVLCGGEAFPQDLAEKLVSKADQVWNMYGPTETTVWSTCYRVKSGSEPVYIGHPIANTQCHVLDESLQRVPVGVSGELYIGGDGVASGYLERPELTAERFIDDPYRGKPGALMYRTGDLVRWRHDGSLEYFRRMDDQVKLRGFRIELGEIESVLTGNPDIAQAAATLRSYGATDQRLVAYVCFKDGVSLTNTELRRYLRGQLPQYMIPQLFMELDRMPLTPNGKVDRKELPEPMQAVDQSSKLKAPDTKTEKEIAAIWREVLGVEDFGVDQNFFDVGGHSLLALNLIYRIDASFGVKITPLDILLNSLGQIAAQIDQQRLSDAPRAEGSKQEASAGDNGIISRFFARKRRN